MNIPNFDSSNHAGIGRLSSELQSSAYLALRAGAQEIKSAAEISIATDRYFIFILPENILDGIEAETGFTDPFRDVLRRAVPVRSAIIHHPRKTFFRQLKVSRRCFSQSPFFGFSTRIRQ